MSEKLQKDSRDDAEPIAVAEAEGAAVEQGGSPSSVELRGSVAGRVAASYGVAMLLMAMLGGGSGMAGLLLQLSMPLAIIAVLVAYCFARQISEAPGAWTVGAVLLLTVPFGPFLYIAAIPAVTAGIVFYVWAVKFPLVTVDALDDSMADVGSSVGESERSPGPSDVVRHDLPADRRG